MVIDAVTAPVVREIFLEEIAEKEHKIAFMSNRRKVLIPMEYQKLSGKNMEDGAMRRHRAAVLRIQRLNARVNLRAKMSHLSKAQKRKAWNGWAITENSHEPIVPHKECDCKVIKAIRNIGNGLAFSCPGIRYPLGDLHEAC